MRRKYANNIFRIYNDKVGDSEKLYDCFYCLYIDLIEAKKLKKIDNTIMDIFLLHSKNCKNDPCKCKLLDLMPINFLSIEPANFVEHMLMRIGFYIETVFTRVDYTSNYYLTILLSEYFYIFKQNYLMSFSVIQTYLNSYHNHHTTTFFQFVNLCNLISRYSNYCIDKILYQDYVSFYQLLIHNINISKLMNQFCTIFEKQILFKENFESGIKLTHDYYTNEITKISSSFLSSHNLDNIINLLKEQNDYYKHIVNSLLIFIDKNPITREIPFEFSIKFIFFFYLFNNGQLPIEILSPSTASRSTENIFSDYISKINFSSSNSFYKNIDKLLNDHLKHISKSNNFIIKCFKGFKIDYFSADLAYKLGYTISKISLIGEEMDILFPKEIAVVHKRAMMKFLIAEGNFMVKKKKYLFTYEKQIIPCEFAAYTMPGLKRKYSLLINIKLKPKKSSSLFFMVNEIYDVVAISKELEKSFLMTLKLISKFEINLLEIFDISIDYINNVFQNDLMTIRNIKKNIGISTEVSFSNWLFHSKLTEQELLFLKNFELFDYIQKGKKITIGEMEDLKEKVESLCINRNKKRFLRFEGSKVKIQKNKVLIFQNIFRFFIRLTEMETFDENAKQINESIYKIKRILKGKESTLNIQDFKEYEKNWTEIANDNKLLNRERNNMIDVKIFLKALYGFPFFVIKIKDKSHKFSLNEIGVQNDAKIEKTEIYTSQILQEEVSKEKNHSKQKKRNSRKGMNLLMKVDSFGNDVSKNNLVTEGNEQMKKVIIKKLNNNFKIYYDDKLLIFGLFAMLIVSIGITTFLFFLQDGMLNYSLELFQCLHSNLKQRDSMYNIFNTLLSILYNMKSLSNSESNGIALNSYFANLLNNVQHFEESYHTFYHYAIKKKDFYEKNQLRKHINFIKIQQYWTTKDFSSNYIDEVYYILYLGYQAAFEVDSLDDINKDIDILLFDNYTNNIEEKVHSDYIKLMYYMKENTLEKFDTIFANFTINIVEVFNNFYSTSNIKYIITESSGLLTYILFFILVFIFLHMNNKFIFNHVLLMYFANISSHDYDISTISYKNHKENIFLHQKLKAFQSLLQSFDPENLGKFISNSSFIENYFAKKNNENPPLFNNTPSEQVNNISNSIISKKVTKSHIQGTSSLVMLNKNDSKKTLSKLNNPKSETKKSISPKRRQSLLILPAITNQNSTTNTLNNNTDTLQNSLSLPQIFKLTENSGINLIKNLVYFIAFSLLIILAFIALKTYFSLIFLRDFKIVFKEFEAFTNQYSLLYLTFNFLRVFLLAPFSQKNINVLEKFLELEKNNKQNIIELDFSQFSKTNEVYHKYKTENIDIDSVAGSFFNDGIDVATSAIYLYINQVLNHYKTSNATIKTVSQLSQFLQDNGNIESMTLIEIGIGFIYKSFQEEIYSSFSIDANNIRKSFKLKVTIFNLFCLFYCCIIFIIVIFGVILFVHRKVSIMRIGSKRFGNTIHFWLEEQVE